MRCRTNTAAGVILLAVYWYFVIQLTGSTPTNFIIIRDFARTINLSLVPFHDIAEVLTTNDVVGSVIQIVGNLVMFVPLGVLVPCFGVDGAAQAEPSAWGCVCPCSLKSTSCLPIGQLRWMT